MGSIVHVIGTGTIGEPLIGLLADHKEEFDLDEVTFHKRTPTIRDKSAVEELILNRGTKLAVDKDVKNKFVDLGYEPTLETIEAIKRADVVIDCTPAGNENKRNYSKAMYKSVKLFVAQGSEDGFGKKYAKGINAKALKAGEDRFIQVVSCNTHAVSSLINTFGFDERGNNHLVSADFSLVRRANDISQNGHMVSSPTSGTHPDKRFGTHHAKDAHGVFKTMGYDIDVFSSAMLTNTQYMHSTRFKITLDEDITLDEVKNKVWANKMLAFTHRPSASEIFSFGRDHGYYGRILNQAVIPIESLAVSINKREIVGYCFTPQDGNSLLSSVAITLWGLDPKSAPAKLKALDKYIFQEI